MYSRGIKDIPVARSAEESQPKIKKRPKRARRQPRAEVNDELQGETAPEFMDIDETFWTEEPVISTSKKKVRRSATHSPPRKRSHISPRQRVPMLRNLFPRLALTYAAFSNLKAFRQRQHARAAGLLRSSGGALTAFLHLFSARSAAESHTNCFLFTEFKDGPENILFHRGCGRLEYACNLDTLGVDVQIKP